MTACFGHEHGGKHAGELKQKWRRANKTIKLVDLRHFCRMQIANGGEPRKSGAEPIKNEKIVDMRHFCGMSLANGGEPRKKWRRANKTLKNR